MVTITAKVIMEEPFKWKSDLRAYVICKMALGTTYWFLFQGDKMIDSSLEMDLNVGDSLCIQGMKVFVGINEVFVIVTKRCLLPW